ncbi:hypothetical protein MUB24_15135 [Lederbergia sp. NSJ-179]|uniref:hypothetical protein n=1 Tax=Lederbergia sp. NSJ-179 TaxID=2931402 RepID=UPI001FD4B959|nr:hypothetical protein [Lederbergia sp. NSJ-179]MCJ7842207.1 hypothetical protein [Lederbergia sp. NSJ-179]
MEIIIIGYMGKAVGFSNTVLKGAAGMYQVYIGTPNGNSSLHILMILPIKKLSQMDIQIIIMDINLNI